MQIARALSLIGCASSELQFLGGDDVGILQGLSHAERSHHLGLGASILHRLGEKCFDLFDYRFTLGHAASFELRLALASSNLLATSFSALT
jgi:hypothetical protein